MEQTYDIEEKRVSVAFVEWLLHQNASCYTHSNYCLKRKSREQFRMPDNSWFHKFTLNPAEIFHELKGLLETNNPAIFTVISALLAIAIIISLFVDKGLAPLLVCTTILYAAFSILWFKVWSQRMTETKLAGLYEQLNHQLEGIVKIESIKNGYQDLLAFIGRRSSPLRIYIHDYKELQGSKEWKYVSEVLTLFCRNIQHGMTEEDAKIYIFYTEASKTNIYEFSQVENKFLDLFTKKYIEQYNTETHDGYPINFDNALSIVTPYVKALRMSATDAVSSVVLANDVEGKLLFSIDRDRVIVATYKGFMTGLLSKGFDKALEDEYAADIRLLAEKDMQSIRDNCKNAKSLYESNILEYFTNKKCDRYRVLSLNAHCVFRHNELQGQEKDETILGILEKRAQKGQKIDLQSYIMDHTSPELKSWAAFDKHYPPKEYEEHLNDCRQALDKKFSKPIVYKSLPLCRLIFIGSRKEKKTEKAFHTLLVSFYEDFKYEGNLASSESHMPVYELNLKENNDLFVKLSYYFKGITLDCEKV